MGEARPGASPPSFARQAWDPSGGSALGEDPGVKPPGLASSTRLPRPVHTLVRPTRRPASTQPMPTSVQFPSATGGRIPHASGPARSVAAASRWVDACISSSDSYTARQHPPSSCRPELSRVALTVAAPRSRAPCPVTWPTNRRRRSAPAVRRCAAWSCGPGIGSVESPVIGVPLRRSTRCPDKDPRPATWLAGPATSRVLATSRGLRSARDPRATPAAPRHALRRMPLRHGGQRRHQHCAPAGQHRAQHAAERHFPGQEELSFAEPEGQKPCTPGNPCVNALSGPASSSAGKPISECQPRSIT